MAIVNKLQVFDEHGNLVDYDILASDVKFSPDGKDLPAKLNEMQDAIDEAASQGGIQQESDPTVPTYVKGITQQDITNWNNKYTKPASGIPASDLAEGVIPDVSGFATKTEVNAKANTADVYTKTEVNDKVANAGKVKSVSVNSGTPAQPDGNGNVNLVVPAGEKGEKGEKGDTGNVEITDASEIVTIIQNNLDSSNGNDILSARQGKILKQVINTVNGNIQALVNALANLAFAGERPTLEALDWTGGTFYADFTLQLTGVSIVSQTASNGKQVEHQNYQLVIATDNGYTIDNDSVIEVTNRGQAVQHTFANNTLTIADVFGSYVIRIAATANFFSVQVPSAVANQLDVLDENGDPFSSNTVIIDKSGSSLAFHCTVKPTLLYSCDVAVTMGSVDVTTTCYIPSTGEVSIPQVTGDVVISVSNLQSYNPLFKNVRAAVANTGYKTMKVLNKDTGDTDDGFFSPLVNIGGNTKFTFSTGLANKSVYMLFYDDNGEYLTSFRQNSDPRTDNIPIGAKYARLTSTTASLANCYFTGDDTQVRLWNGANESLADAAGAREFMASAFGPKTDAHGSILHADMDRYQTPGVKYNDGPLADEHLSFPERVITREIVLPEIGSDGNRKITFWSGLAGTVFMVYDGDGHSDGWMQGGDATTGKQVNLVGDYAYAKYARMVVPLASYYDFANSPLWVKDANGNALWSNEGISEEENNGND